MPTYEYVCTVVRPPIFEIVQAIQRRRADECPVLRRTAAEGVPPAGHRLQGLGLLRDRPRGSRSKSLSSGSEKKTARPPRRRQLGSEDSKGAGLVGGSSQRRRGSSGLGARLGGTVERRPRTSPERGMAEPAEIGVFGGSGFYAFLDDDETVERRHAVRRAVGAPPVIGDVGRQAVAFIPRHGATARVPAAPDPVPRQPLGDEGARGEPGPRALRVRVAAAGGEARRLRGLRPARRPDPRPARTRSTTGPRPRTSRSPTRTAP